MDKISVTLSVTLAGLAIIPFFLGKFRNNGGIKVCISSVFSAFCCVINTDMSLSHVSELATYISYFVLYFIISFPSIGLMYLGSMGEADARYELLASKGIKDKDNPYYMN